MKLVHISLRQRELRVTFTTEARGLGAATLRVGSIGLLSFRGAGRVPAECGGMSGSPLCLLAVKSIGGTNAVQPEGIRPGVEPRP